MRAPVPRPPRRSQREHHPQQLNPTDGARLRPTTSTRSVSGLARGGEEHLSQALSDLEHLKLTGKGALGRAERELLQKVLAEREALRREFKRSAGGLRTAFASGGAGLATDSADSAAAAPSSARDESFLTSSHPLSNDSKWMGRLHDHAGVRHAYLIDAYRTRVDDDPVDDGLDVDMDLIRRARALRGASQLARTESK